MELGAVDGVVFADVNIVRILADGQIGTVGNVGKGLVGGRRHGVCLAVLLRFLPCFLCPLAGDDIVGDPVFHQVHGNHGELLGSAAL